MFRRSAVTVAFLCLLLIGISVTQAHAELESSDPAANATLDTAPDEIRLWFTEPLEPMYSRFTLIDQSGTTVDTARSQVAPDSPRELLMQPGTLEKGVYTVAWRTLSAGDGHSAAGSFSFGVGVAVSATDLPPVIDEHVAPESVAIRWVDLVALSLLIGSLGFSLLVATAAVSPTGETRALRVLAWVGWVATGVASLLMLLLEAATAGGTSLIGSLALIGGVVGTTAYGSLWLVRQALWLATGAVLLLGGRSRRGQWLALAVGAAILLTQSLFSHGSATQDATAAIVGDWLHFLAATLWIGGLVAFLVVLVIRRGAWAITAESCGHLVAAFSNYARVAVLALVVSGIYAAWLDVGSVDALLTTVYGRALLLKLILFLPLLGLAAVNLLVTSRRLKSGDRVWVGRLRVLVGLEIVLTVAILGFVAVMTSGSPARFVQAANIAAAQAAAARPKPFTDVKTVDDLHVHLSISPGVVGENTFSLMLMDDGGKAVTASLIRMRFDNLDQSLGQSELRPTAQPDGSYSIRGANLSVPGNWRIRLTIQRPDKFDSVVDFTPQIVAAPMIMAAPPNDTLSDNARMWATLLTGIALLALGGAAMLRRNPTVTNGAWLLGAAMIAGGFIFAATGVWLAKGGGTIEVVDAWARPAGQNDTAVIYLKVINGTSSPVQVTSVQTDVAASATLHQTSITDNIARMRGLNVVDVPADSTVELKPAGDHIMLQGLTQPLVNGQMFTVMVMLSTGDEYMIPVHVQPDAPTDESALSATESPDEYSSGGS